MKKINVATVFSGIGSIEHALKKQKIKSTIIFACDNGERELKLNKNEINELLLNSNNRESIVEELYEKTGKHNYVKDTYLANYDLSHGEWFEDIRFIDGKKYEGKVDLFVGGSPCQSFSISGKRAGLEDTRGTLFYDYARMVNEIKPKVFIYENVPGMLSHDNGNTWKVISDVFDSLGYEWSATSLLASYFDIPQNRRRLYVVGFRKDLNCKKFEFPKGHKTKKVVADYLDADIDKSYFHGEKGFKWVTSEKSLKKRVSINSTISRTQTANQQFNWCGDMRFYPIEEQMWALEDNRVYVGEYKGVKGVCRKLTPRECLRLMGYSDDFKIVVPDNVMYRQCGNSIVVNVMEAILKQIVKTGVFDND
ncbi:MAG: DNA cytosine methyltransferase [Candidatus Enterosoma sp.]|nr:DNA cytosine methyltransferase [Candidatus Enterosoma sp.]